jgi:hypothetical protein
MRNASMACVFVPLPPPMVWHVSDAERLELDGVPRTAHLAGAKSFRVTTKQPGLDS